MSDRQSSTPAIPPTARLMDRIFFKEHPGRRTRLRRPVDWEYQNEFRQFGMHEEERRRVIVARIPAGMAKRHNVDFMRIPFLLFADETVEDADEVLGPILDEMMQDAAAGYGMRRK